MPLGRALSSILLLSSLFAETFACDKITRQEASASVDVVAIQSPSPRELPAEVRCDAGSCLDQFESASPHAMRRFHQRTDEFSDVKIERWKSEIVALAMQDKSPDRMGEVFGTANRGNKFAVFDAMVAQAEVPNCLHKDGLKRQPPRIGFFVFNGVIALPFVALAKLRGKCN